MQRLDLSCPCELTECYPSHSGEFVYHTEIIVDGELYIPEVKPPCEKILNISRNICLTKVVPVPVKLDNGCVAGYKLLVVGTLRLGFEYCACVPEQNVHFVHFDVPFQGLITGNPCHRPIPLHDCNFEMFDVCACVEHIEAQKVSPRILEKVVVLLFWLQRKNCSQPNPCHPDVHVEPDSPPGPYTRTSKVSKQISVNDTLIIRPQKPPAECILNSSVDFDISKAEVIATPLTDVCHTPVMKVAAAGKVWITVKYIADLPNQQVHATAFSVPVEALIEWPGGPPEHTPVLVTATIEQLQVDLLDPRLLFVGLILRLDAARQ